MNSFYERFIIALQEGILLTVKYGIILILIVYSYLFLMDTRQKSINGQAAAEIILEYQNKNWLPKFPIPQKSE